MAQDVITVRLDSSGYYGGVWFDDGGEHTVEDTARLRTAVKESDDAELVESFTAPAPDGVFTDLTVERNGSVAGDLAVDGSESVAGSLDVSGGATIAGAASLAERLSLAPQSSAPSSPSAGDYALADGTNWDPGSGGTAKTVIYDGSGWVVDVDLGVSL